MTQDNFITRLITFLLLGALVLVALFILKPIFVSIIAGLLLAYIFYPVYKKIYARIKRENIATSLLIAGIILVIAVPLYFIVPALIKQTFEIYISLQKVNFVQILEKFLPSLSAEVIRTFAVNLNNFIAQLFSSLLNQFTKIIVDFPNLMLQSVVVLFTFYFAVRDADKLKEYCLKLSPFSHATAEKFLEKFRKITDTIIYGQFFIAVIQGIALGVGLLILGVPKILLLTVLTIFASMIPVLGSWLVWLPLGIMLIATGLVFKGVILLLYGAFFVSIIDNVIRPYLLAKKTDLPVVVALLGIIGGLYAFGIIGLVLGPLIFAYILIIFEFYRQGKLNELFKK